MRIMTSIMSVVCVAAINAQCTAQLVFDSMHRRVAVNMPGFGLTDQSVSTGLGPFEAIIDPAQSDLTASQFSEVSSCGAHGRFDAPGRLISLFFPESSSSGMTVVFHVDQPTPFLLSGDVWYQNSINRFGSSFRLQGGAFDIRVSSTTHTGTQTFTGVFDPGVSYTLNFSASGGTGGQSSYYGGGGLIHLVTGAPCDSPEMQACAIARSTGGGVGFAQINDVIANWNLTVAPGATGDHNFDGVVNLTDISLVIDAWGELCPY